jgi:hypothetical protein
MEGSLATDIVSGLTLGPTFMIPRKATLHIENQSPETRYLSEWRDLDAYVLLGEPGLGKSIALEMEHQADPVGTILMTARDFVTLDPPKASAGKTFLIDALDERRASSADNDGPLDEIRSKLDKLGRPKFRLTCREADWSASDTRLLHAIAPTGQVHELRLGALDEDEIVALLTSGSRTSVDNPSEFFAKANQRRLGPLLGNPLLLELLVQAVEGNKWPTNRHETYLLACKKLATENNRVHRRAKVKVETSLEQTMHDAGLLCALLLLSDSVSYATEFASTSAASLSVESIPKALGIPVDRAVHLLSCNLFAAEAETRVPRHRTIAEFLGAHALAGLIAKGLPVARLLALMAGFDGRIVDPLRGLYAWTATCSNEARRRLIERDPLGIVLYGDVHPFSRADKLFVFEALRAEAQRFRWFRNESWEAHPFGALGTLDLEDWIADQLNSHDRSPAHEVVLDCIADAVTFGDRLPNLLDVLERVIRDSTHWARIRRSALDALVRQSTQDDTILLRVIHDIAGGEISDPDDELLGTALSKLYPARISAKGVCKYLHKRKQDNFIGAYHMFWAVDVIAETPSENIPDLMDELVQFARSSDAGNRDFAVENVISKLLPDALEKHGKLVKTSRIFAWLEAATAERGHFQYNRDEPARVRVWFSENPIIQKEVFSFALHAWAPKTKGNSRQFWPCERMLHSAVHPKDWYVWLLSLASTTKILSIAKYCVEEAAFAAIEQTSEYSISIDMVNQWLLRNALNWPGCESWTIGYWTCELSDYRREEVVLKKKREKAREDERDARRLKYAPHFSTVISGNAWPSLMQEISMAHEKRYSNIVGESAADRVGDLMGINEHMTEQVISGLLLVLQRDDIPSWEEILRLDSEGVSSFVLRQPCLLAAKLCEAKNPGSALHWSKALVSSLVAFYLTSNAYDEAWFESVVHHRASEIAEVFIAYNVGAVRAKVPRAVGLRGLSREKEARELSRLIIPTLIRNIPTEATEAQVEILSSSLLPAALTHLEFEVVREFIDERLRAQNIDSLQRVALLVAKLEVDPAAATKELVLLTQGDSRLLTHLAEAMNAEFNRRVTKPAYAIQSLGDLAAVFAADCSPEIMRGPETDVERRRDIARVLIQNLGMDTKQEAREQLIRLRDSVELVEWRVFIEARLEEQAKATRVESFAFADVESVALTLANLAPANVADLVALVTAQLEDLAEHIRFDDSNHLKLFWRENVKKVQVPRVENDCRDILLSPLRARMKPFGVHIEKEIQAANEKRCDVHAAAYISGKRIAIPIEIKKEEHPKVWTAWEHQLLKHYSANPAAKGFGVYVVFWFGVEVRDTPEGISPTSPAHMAQLFSERIGREYWPTLSGLVLDLSPYQT